MSYIPGAIVTAKILYIYTSVYSGGGSGEGGDNPNPTLYPPGEGDGGSMPLANVKCENVQQAVEPAPDGAIYFLPKGVDNAYLQNAANHISTFSQGKTFWQVKDEIVRMYTVPSHPNFVDFKRWGTPSGPAGSASGGTYDYYSQEVQGWVYNSNAYEAFGNYFFGMICIFAGFSDYQTLASAAYASFTNGGSLFDDPQDRPHVNAGMAAAQRYIAQQSSGQFDRELRFYQGCLP